MEQNNTIHYNLYTHLNVQQRLTILNIYREYFYISSLSISFMKWSCLEIIQTISFLYFKFVLLCPIIKNNMLIDDLEISNYSYYYIFYRKTQFLFDWWASKFRKSCKLCNKYGTSLLQQIYIYIDMEKQIVEFILKTVVDSSTRTIWFYGMVYGELSHVHL